MVKAITLIIRLIVIGLIYIVIFRIIRMMYGDLKGNKNKKQKHYYALEVLNVPKILQIAVGSIYPINGKVTIGRNEKSEIFIDDAYISSKHAEIYINDERIFIDDLNSTNGTKINGKKIKGKQEIYDGDKIEIGRVIFKVIS